MLRRGIDILTATPGRLLDLHGQGFISFDDLQVFVLDEADRMLDMGFIHDVRRVIATIPKQRQTLLFSATMPTDIQDLADNILIDPVSVAADPPATTVELIEQSVFFVEKRDKRDLLVHLLGDRGISRSLVFTRTKHGANRVATHLQKREINAMAIHGNKSQGARERALEGFKRGRVRVLVATDIAARGIDVELISHVINFDIPNIPETYVHRIGRTARAGASGIALSFCQEDERPYLVDIQRLIGQHIPVVEEHPHRSFLGTPEPADLRPPGRRSAAQQPRPRAGAEGAEPTRRRRPRRRPRRRSPGERR
jgi:ATP-dependent RNA helicase RhlE